MAGPTLAFSSISSAVRTPRDDRNARLTTHFGVWWKVYFDSEYIEDFPYCPCCQGKNKLVQTEWYPVEVYKCPQTGTKVKLFDEVPQKRGDLLKVLYRTYFHPGGFRLQEYLYAEYRRLKELNPDAKEEDFVREIFGKPPLSGIPAPERDKILRRYPSHGDAFSFIARNFRSYERYFKQQPEGSDR